MLKHTKDHEMVYMSALHITLTFSYVFSTLHCALAIDSIVFEKACDGGVMSGVLHQAPLTLRSRLECMMRCANDVSCEAATWTKLSHTCTFYENYWCTGVQQVLGVITRRRKVRRCKTEHLLMLVNESVCSGRLSLLMSIAKFIRLSAN